MDMSETPGPQPGGDGEPTPFGDSSAYGDPVPLLLLDQPNSIETEAIRGLRTRVIAQHVREGRRALVFCTAAAGSGCSVVVANLAVAFSQAGLKTAVVDADLRGPSLAQTFGLAPDILGLADHLVDPAIKLDDVLQGEILPNLTLVPAGTLHPSPQDLLASVRFRESVNRLLREFDLTIFDTTPTNLCTDGQRVAAVAGYAMIVARRDRSYVNDIKVLARMLRADKSTVVGSVLSDF